MWAPEEAVRMYVLVIDDDPMVCKMARFLLTEEGYEVDVATSGEAAVAIIERRQPDLFVLDMVLPDVDGFEIYRQLQNASADARILFLAPRGLVKDCDSGLELHMGCILSKPFEAEEFVTCVNTLAWRCLTERDGKLRDRIRVGNAELRLRDSRLIIRTGEILRLVTLTAQESTLLGCLMLNPGRVVPGDVLRGGAWEREQRSNEAESVRENVGGLLKKIAAAVPGWSHTDSPGYIETVGDSGYRFNVISA
jgi:two-component system, OmpR family, alkaline phosphatase synthesis response regulator PhoP